jgi:hypothetical protein
LHTTCDKSEYLMARRACGRWISPNIHAGINYTEREREEMFFHERAQSLVGAESKEMIPSRHKFSPVSICSVRGRD